MELSDGVNSVSEFMGSNGQLLPQRAILHEIIVQTVSERKILSGNDTNYEGTLKNVIARAQGLSSYKDLEQSDRIDPQKISSILDELELERLPLHAQAEQVMMVTGGAGTGKSSFVKHISKSQAEVYQNAVQINPDHFREFLADKAEQGRLFSTYTHHESSMIANEVMKRLGDRMERGLDAPHVLMDVTVPNEKRMEFAMRFDKLQVMHGSAPADVTVERVYQRGIDTGRVLPTRAALGTTAGASRHLHTVLEHPDLELSIYNTDVPKEASPTLIASWDKEARQMNVVDPDLFKAFIQRQDINIDANSPERLWDGADRSPERMAQHLSAYTNHGIVIEFVATENTPPMRFSDEGVEILETLENAPKANFMMELADKFGSLGKNGGFIAGAAFGTLSGAFTLAAGGGKAEAAEAVYEAALPYGESQIDAARGDLEALKRSATIETTSTVGAVGGAVGGAALGTMIFPGVGTVVGGVIGGIGGGIISGEATAAIYDNADNIADFFDKRDDRLFERLPTEIVESAPPELQHLVELKRMHEDALDMREELGRGRTRNKDTLAKRDIANARIDHIEKLYDQAFEEMDANGSLAEAQSFLNLWDQAGKLSAAGQIEATATCGNSQDQNHDYGLMKLGN